MPIYGLEVQLNKRSMEVLQELSELTGLSDIDNLDRALQVCALIERSLAAGCSLRLTRPDGTAEAVDTVN